MEKSTACLVLRRVKDDCQTCPEGDIQRRSSAANRGAQENAGFCTQEGLDGRRRNQGVDSKESSIYA
ncbi:hypothetical protein ABFA07_022634 [Porites harrisoni]